MRLLVISLGLIAVGCASSGSNVKLRKQVLSHQTKFEESEKQRGEMARKVSLLEANLKVLVAKVEALEKQQTEDKTMIKVLSFRADLAEEKMLTPELLKTVNRQEEVRARFRKKRRGCIKEISRLGRNLNSKDGWDTDMILRCNGKNVFIVSAGQDKSFATEDDVKLRLSK